VCVCVRTRQLAVCACATVVNISSCGCLFHLCFNLLFLLSFTRECDSSCRHGWRACAALVVVAERKRCFVFIAVPQFFTYQNKPLKSRALTVFLCKREKRSVKFEGRSFHIATQFTLLLLLLLRRSGWHFGRVLGWIFKKMFLFGNTEAVFENKKDFINVTAFIRCV